ncbi:gluconeogenesis factor YvcK family protein [Longimycelium tulufanense]|uniref:gluconeogenesis factor YvcK family protein n=1 Tax=Longimycelium tulufanense TaxID=907463 RepID=UPI00166D82BA|nr:uridine diphosphate-N-acetylglucosamine-binding protein YvcK [Longimycelium tulufanense]
MRAVALGGGHGLQATLGALRRITDDVTAVVTVADDGGSSGRLRRELNLLPPGDLRKALAALADDGNGQLWSRVFQHRFGGSGALAGHAVGNLVLAGLLEVLGDPVAVLDEARRLLGVRGRVLPMSREPLDIEADVTGLDEDAAAVRRIRGQVAVATTPGQVQRVRLLRADDPGAVPRACPEAVRAVLDADVVLLGPGSWFTSVLPHLMVPELQDALVETAARRVVVLNLAPQPGETAGFSPEQHLHVLAGHAPRLRVDAVVADRSSAPTPDRLRRAAAELGGRTVFAPVTAPGSAARHDPEALAVALHRAFGIGPDAPGADDAPPLSGPSPAAVTAEGEEDTPWR